LQKIVAVIHPQADDHMVEIGPGEGALTFRLLERLEHLDVVELDRDLVAALQGRSNKLIVHSADALEFDFGKLTDQPHALRVVGNLPYNISTPLLFHLLKYAPKIRDMHFLLQREVVDRMAAAPDSKTYGRLSVMVQYACKVEKLFNVSPRSFRPPPKVDSAVVRLIPHNEPPLTPEEFTRFELLVREAFSHRRKTLRKSLHDLVSTDTFERAGIDSGLRPEQLSVGDFVRLSQA
jgi:16S rRNA (adenine1518-N6/adenine1519-N6)-dimethyltransferase